MSTLELLMEECPLREPRDDAMLAKAVNTRKALKALKPSERSEGQQTYLTALGAILTQYIDNRIKDYRNTHNGASDSEVLSFVMHANGFTDVERFANIICMPESDVRCVLQDERTLSREEIAGICFIFDAFKGVFDGSPRSGASRRRRYTVLSYPAKNVSVKNDSYELIDNRTHGRNVVLPVDITVPVGDWNGDSAELSPPDLPLARFNFAEVLARYFNDQPDAAEEYLKASSHEA